MNHLFDSMSLRFDGLSSDLSTAHMSFKLMATRIFHFTGSSGLHLEDQVIALTHDTIHLRLEFRLAPVQSI